MTSSKTTFNDAELIARLRHKTQHRSSDDTCAAYFKRWEKLDNPDGLEAADRIEALLAAQADYDARIRSALTVTPHDPTKVQALVEALEQSREGWSNALELGIIASQHRTSASILRDACAAALAAMKDGK